MDTRNKKVVVTGGSSGIGLELVRELLKDGCQVVAASRTMENSKINHEKLHKKNCDVSLQGDIDELFDFAMGKMGDIDIFIANAGFAYYEEIKGADWEHIKKIYDTNTLSVIYSAEKMKELYPERPYNFVCVASAIGLLSIPGYAIYSSTKAALNGFANAYRYELKGGQKFQVVYPISTKTHFFDDNEGIDPPPPVQTPEHVAGSIIKGIKKDKDRIFPSKIFYFMNRFLPFLQRFYVRSESKKFEKLAGEGKI